MHSAPLGFTVLLAGWTQVGASGCLASSRNSCAELTALSALDNEHTHGWTDQLGDTQVCVLILLILLFFFTVVCFCL